MENGDVADSIKAIIPTTAIACFFIGNVIHSFIIHLFDPA
ncbi:hypothetical protein [Brevibacillus laterosporus]